MSKKMKFTIEFEVPDDIEIGVLEGEQCNRDGCEGTIVEHDSDGGCSCHINPPCSYCTTSREYCSVCEWDAQEEEREEDNKRSNVEYAPMVYKQRAFEDLDKSKIDWIINGGWHSGMKVKGVYPKGTTEKEIIGALGCGSHVCMANLSMNGGVFYCSWFTD